MNSKRVIALALGVGGAYLLSPSERMSSPSDPDAPPTQVQPRRLKPLSSDEKKEVQPSDPAWWSDRLMVRLAPNADAAEVAAAAGASVLHAPGPGGLATFRVPEGSTPRALAAQLAEDPRVRGTARSGRVFGASDSASLGSLASVQWHLRSARVLEPSRACSAITVAVLDTGVAYGSVDGACTAAPSLKSMATVAPWDFVNDDGGACDDHQHGTHIASLIASRGAVMGLAPYVTIMPVKVLDAHNSGDEQALIDGLRWAVENGADVINMSLSFGPGYVPSPELLAALRGAADAGVVMIGASGNTGATQVTWPAASPLVLSVGATTLSGDDTLTRPSYSNTGTQLDLLAPGGSLDGDLDGDGYNDGVLAETILPGDPDSFGYYFYEGTSQAAALVTASAAWLLATGAAPEEVSVALQASARSRAKTPFADGGGAGSIDLNAALDLMKAGLSADASPVYASVLPTLKIDAATGLIVPTARILVVDDTGAPLDGVAVMGQAHARDGEEQTWSCDETVDGLCEIELSGVDDDGGALEEAWRFTVDGVITDGVMRSPTTVLFGSDGLEIMSEALGDLDSSASALAFIWDEGEVEDLGLLAASVTVLDLGGDGARAPTALVMTAGLANALFEAHALALDLSGSGLSTDALGVTASGLSTDALGVLTASGLSTDALGVVSLSGTSGSGLSTDALGASGGSGGVVGVRGSGAAAQLLGLSALALTSPDQGQDLGLGLTGTPLFSGTPEAADALQDTSMGSSFALSEGAEGTSVVLWLDEVVTEGEASSWPDEPALEEGDEADTFGTEP